MSLKSKYALLTAALVLALFTAFGLVNYRFHSDALRDELIRRTEVTSEFVKASLFAHMLEGRSSNFQRFLEVQVREDIEEVRIFEPDDGTILASSIPKEIGKSIYPKDFEQYSLDAKPRVFEHLKNGRLFFSKVEPLYNQPACYACHDPSKKVIGVLDIEISPELSLSESLEHLRYLTLVFLVGAVCFTAAVMYMATARWLTAPLHAVMNVMQRASRGDVGARYHSPRIDEIGHLSKSINTLLETSETRDRESETRNQERFQSLERLASVGSMTSAIAHDIKNPLAGISTAVQVLSEDLPEGDPRREVVEEIQARIQKLDQSIRALRNYAKPAAPQPVAVPPRTFLESVVRQIHRDVTAASVEVALQVSSGVQDVEIDPDLMQESLRDVALYCLRSMKASGQLTVSCTMKDETRVQFRVEGADGHLAPAVGNDLFDPMSGGDKHGLALALASAQRTIEDHHGIISVDSAPTGGIRFTVVLPVSQKLAHA